MMTLAYKAELVDYCIQLLKKREIELQQEVEENMKISNDYGAPKDRYDGFKNQQLRKVEMLSAQRQLVQADILVYLQINLQKPSKAVQLGTLFKANDQTIFVATSMGKIEFQGESIFVISPKVPYYDAVKGLKEGKTGSFRGKDVLIESLV